MRLREVYRYEIAYRLRSPSTWFYALFLFLIMLWNLGATAESGAAVHANAPQKLAEAIVRFGGLFGLLVSAALFADAAIRDVAVGMDPLLFTTQLRKAEFLGGRFLATLTVNAIVLLAIPLGHAFGTMLPFEPGTFGPLRFAAYVQPFLLLMLPNLVLAAAILFAMGALTRQAIPVYLATIGVFIGYIVAANYWQLVDNPTLSSLADPLGINALEQMNRYRTPIEQETRLIGFPALLLWNRLVWISAAAMVLAVLHRAFRFAHATDGGRWFKRTRATIDAPPMPERSLAQHQLSVVVHGVDGDFGPRSRLLQTLSVARRAFGDVMAGRAFKIVLLAAVGFTVLIGWNVTETVFESSTWPITKLVAGEVLSQRIGFIPWVIIILYAGELVWKERATGAAEISDAMPLPDGIALLGRFLALASMIAAMQAAFMIGGVLLQTLQGYYHYELGLYARILFGFNFVDLVLLAALAMTVHVLVNSKYVGHIVALLAVIFTKVAPGIGIEDSGLAPWLQHHLVVYNTDPGWSYSEMNGFGPFVAPYAWFKSYWAAWALMLGVLSTLFWVRGRESGLRRRFASAGSRFMGPVARVTGLAMVLILGLGGFIFYNTNILNVYRTYDQPGSSQAEYEKRYARFETTAQPTIADVTLRVEVYPEDPRVDVRGTYLLANRTSQPIDSVHVYTDPDEEARSFSFDRKATPVLTDAEVGYRIFALEQPLLPGDSLQLTFDVRLGQRGFSNSTLETDIVRNGTYINRRRLPFIGYQPGFELTIGPVRERFGLAPQTPLPGPNDPGALRSSTVVQNEDLVHIQTTIGTTGDQTAVTTGVLRRSWTENGRRYFDYESEGAISFDAPIFSGRYAVVDDRWTSSSSPGDSVSLQVLHHPEHADGANTMMRGMKASLDYYSNNLGPYPYHQLRIVEIPPYSIFGHADAGTIGFSEDAFFGRIKKGEVDQVFYGTAHETAHQWGVSAAPVRGVGYLSESFANYSAVMLTEKTFGVEAARQAYDFHMERYLAGRGEQSREVPLLDVDRQTYIMYRKGAIALLTLRDFIGEAAVNTALRRYREKYGKAGPPYATALDQFAELRAVTPDSLQYVLKDMFETITLWEVKTKGASVQPSGNGAYLVTLDVVAKKMRADRVGAETEIPMNDLVEIGVFAPNDSGKELGAPLHLQRHRIRSGAQTITVTVPREPARAGIDPYRKLVDRDREDNVVGVEVLPRRN